jgi:uncharacterized protein (DUF1778 family)
MATNSLITSGANPSCSPESGLSTIAADAPQPVVRWRELKPQQPVEAAGAAINRRSIMNMMVSAAALTATSVISDQAVAQSDDGEVLSLASEILRLNQLAHQDDDEMVRLQSIWCDAGIRLREEDRYSRDEQWEMVKAIPESAEHTRLVKKSDPYFESADRLMKRLWSIPAKNKRGKGREGASPVRLCPRRRMASVRRGGRSGRRIDPEVDI